MAKAGAFSLRRAPQAPPAAATEDLAGGLASPAEAGAQRVRFPCFDGLRALAAGSVLVTHVAFSSGYSLRPENRAGPYLARLDVGVSLFFVVSGFLLYRPFVAAHLSGARPLALRAYFKRRLLRIVPAYWVALTAVFVLGHEELRSLGDAVVYYGLLQIYSDDHVRGGIQQAWSLCTEESFYLFLPAYAWALRRLARRVARPLALELAGVGALYAVSVVFRVGVMARIDATSSNTFDWLPATSDLFALGVLLAVGSAWLAQRDPGGAERPPALLERACRSAAPAWGLAAVTYWVMTTRIGLPRDLSPLSPAQVLARQGLYGLFAFFLVVPAVFGPQDRGLVRRALRSPVAVAVGLLTYGVYLWHELWIDAYFERTGRAFFDGDFSVELAFVGGASLATAALSYAVVERPFLRLRDRPLRRRRPPPAVDAPTG